MLNRFHGHLCNQRTLDPVMRNKFGVLLFQKEKNGAKRFTPAFVLLNRVAQREISSACYCALVFLHSPAARAPSR